MMFHFRHLSERQDKRDFHCLYARHLEMSKIYVCVCGCSDKTGQDLAKESTDGDRISWESTSRHLLSCIWANFSNTSVYMSVNRAPPRLISRRGWNTILGASLSNLPRWFLFFSSSSPKCCERGSVTGAGRTILPSPENLPTIPDLFSKVWGAEPTWRQHYRLLKEKNRGIPSMLTRPKNKETFLKKNLVLLHMLAVPRLRHSLYSTRRR